MLAKIWKVLCLQSWWVMAFALLSAILYEHGLYKREMYYKQLNGQLEALKLEKKLALLRNEELQQLVDSQSDPRWIELVLKEKLGLVAEGEKKVVFISE